MDQASRGVSSEGGRERELQRLLAEERQRSEQRKNNYQTLKAEHIKLQKDFLALQSDLKGLLEETKAITVKRDAETSTLREALAHKDAIVEELRKELSLRDITTVRNQVKEELEEPVRKLGRDCQVLERDKERLSFELKISKQQVEHLQKELVDSVERTRLSFESELNLVKKEKEELRGRYVELNQTPDAQRINLIVQENTRLKAKLNSFQTSFEEAEDNYKKVLDKLETLVRDHEHSEKELNKQLESSRSQIVELNNQIDSLEADLRTSQREKLDIQLVLSKVHKQLDSSKEEVTSAESSLREQRDSFKGQLETERSEFDKERTVLRDEIKRLKLDVISKSEKAADLEKELVSMSKEMVRKMTSVREDEAAKVIPLQRQILELENRIKELQERRDKVRTELDQVRRQLDSSVESRLVTERELIVCKARLEVLQESSKELDSLRRTHSSLHECLNKIKCELLEANSVNKELVRQKERIKDEYHRIKVNLEQERKDLSDFKETSDKNIGRLRACLDEERAEARSRLVHLERQVTETSGERDTLKAKCRHYVQAIEKFEGRIGQLERDSAGFAGRESADGLVSSDAYKALKKRYKDLKRKQSEISSMLNCSLDGSNCVSEARLELLECPWSFSSEVDFDLELLCIEQRMRLRVNRLQTAARHCVPFPFESI
ncbi:Centrosomal protein of 83 kDa [Halotydeus destructor]|nr:Centrosomal protein of 83 kDa [Halotydeus destructor]